MYEKDLERRCDELQEKLIEALRWKPSWVASLGPFEFDGRWTYKNKAAEYGYITFNPRRIGEQIYPCYFVCIYDADRSKRDKDVVMSDTHFTKLEDAKRYIEKQIEIQLAMQ